MPDYITLELSSVESIVQDSSDPGDDPDFIQSAAVIEVTPAIPKGTMIPGPNTKSPYLNWYGLFACPAI